MDARIFQVYTHGRIWNINKRLIHDLECWQMLRSFPPIRGQTTINDVWGSLDYHFTILLLTSNFTSA